LLVPGCYDEAEVTAIARFIASFDPNIPFDTSCLSFFNPEQLTLNRST
jgi:pyruvate-formate lyase-activating enzyme